MVTIRNITRLEAVRDQLNTACKAYFLWDDLVSALTLAGAAERVRSDMQADMGAKVFRVARNQAGDFGRYRIAWVGVRVRLAGTR